MALAIGSRLGHYTVTAKLGEGGMGEVWEANDTKLNRQVALKILPEAFAADPDRLARFQREAQVLASLNHPNIAAIHGIEEAAETRALVLELVEGPTLADRIAKGAIPVDEALPIAKQTAEALEAAHVAGVIHRDLKPANIKVREDGTVKVLDFGLAKALDTTPEGDPSQSPTLTAAATQMGVIMGTAAYMSPEQAKGKVVDKRADVWAFGAVVYEMLTGRRAFTGDDVSDTLAAVLRAEVTLDELPQKTPARLRQALTACLQRDPKQRIHDIADVRLAMEGVFETTVSAPAEAAVAPQLQLWQRPIAVVLIGLVTAAVAGLGVWVMMRSEAIPTPELIRFTIVPSDTAPLHLDGALHDLAISPDGTQVVYQSGGPGETFEQLNLRSIDRFVAALLRGTEGAGGPFVSPDGEWVGFVDGGNSLLQKVSILGGPPVTLTESPNLPMGASWGTDDQIIFGAPGSGLLRVSGGGGEFETLTTLDTEQGETGHLWPFIIPGRDAVVFVISTGAPLNALPSGQLAVLDLATGDVTRLGLAGVSPHYVSTGHLVYAAEDGSVRAVPFDAPSLTVTGNPVPLVEGVSVKSSGAANFSISDSGRLVYALGAGGVFVGEWSLVWVNRDGEEEPLAADPAAYGEFNLSPDGTRVAVRILGDDPAVWIYDLIRGTSTRLTFESDNTPGILPTWTPDGLRVAFGTPLAWKRADGTGDLETLNDEPGQFPQAFSPDGTMLVIEDRPTTGRWGLRMLTLDGDRPSTVLLDDGWTERDAALSPDGRWLAYTSNETGQFEVYVRPFPEVDAGRWQISTDGGVWPLWNPAGDELFYRGPTGVMAVEFEGDPTFAPGVPTLLIERAFIGIGNRRMAVSPDGQRFLLLTDATRDLNAEDVAPAKINVVINWHRELLERVPIR